MSSASIVFTVICPLPSHPSSIFSEECTNSDLLRLSLCAFTVRCRVCPSACWFIRPTEKAAIKGRESAARWLGHNKNTPFHSCMLKKKISYFLFLAVPPRLISILQRKPQMCRNLDWYYLFFSFVSLGNVDLIWAKTMALSSCKIKKGGFGWGLTGKSVVSTVRSQWKTHWSMCFMHVADEWDLTHRTAQWVLLMVCLTQCHLNWLI